MGNFNRNSGGGRGGSGQRFDRDRGPVQMHPATCSNCGASCEVPFKPTGSKPVLCNNCFRSSGGNERRDDRPSYDKPRFDRPSYDKPRFDSPRNDDRRSAPAPFQPQYKEQLDALNVKLDKILNMLQNSTPVKKPEKIAETAINEASVVAPVVEKKKRASKKVTEAPITE